MRRLPGPIMQWIAVHWHITYRVGPEELASKEAPTRKRRSGPNLRWRSSRRETVGIRMGERSSARGNDVKGFDVGIDMGSGSSADQNKVEGSQSNRPSDGAQGRTLFSAGDSGRYVSISGSRIDGGRLVEGRGLTDSIVQFSSATAPGWDKGQSEK